MPRPTINDTPMTAAQRKQRSRSNIDAAIHAEAELAAQHIRATRRLLAKQIGGTAADDLLLAAIDALDRLAWINTGHRLTP